MTFRRKTTQPDPDHPEPVEIDLGSQPPWKADVVLTDMAQRYRMRTIELHSLRNQGGTETPYKVLVHADDADAVRQELIEAELL
jgi:hypothetical protein